MAGRAIPMATPPPAGWYNGQFHYGPPGQIRPTGTSILLFVVTLGIYQYIYNYSVHEEIKRHTARGIGGGVALVLSFLAGVAMPFVTPNEIGNLYALQGKTKPVSAKTGLWIVIPVAVSFVALIATIIAVFTTASYHDGVDSYGGNTRVPDLHSGQISALITVPVLFVFGSLACQVIYFVKSNRALNDCWAALGVRPS